MRRQYTDWEKRFYTAKRIDVLGLGKGEDITFVDGCQYYHTCFDCCIPIESCPAWHPKLKIRDTVQLKFTE